MRRLMTIIAAAALLTACGGDPEQPERPGNSRPPSVNPETPAPPSPDDIPDEILTDPTTRLVSKSLTLRYDNCGVIYSYAPGSDTYGMTDITTGATVSYRPGTPATAALLVNGEPVTLAAIDTIAVTPSDTLWLRLTATDGNRAWLVLAPL